MTTSAMVPNPLLLKVLIIVFSWSAVPKALFWLNHQMSAYPIWLVRLLQYPLCGTHTRSKYFASVSACDVRFVHCVS